MLIVATLCLAAGGILYYISRGQREALLATERTETVTASDLAKLCQAAAGAAGTGSFSQPAEVVGKAVAGGTGLLTAPESKQECVWHRTTATEHYWDLERDSDGDRRRVERTREISSHESETPFQVDDGTGKISINPRDAKIDKPEKVVGRLERDRDHAQSGLLGVLASAFQFGDQTIGIEYEEWIIRTGARLYVLGEASDRSGALQVAKAESQQMIISTRSEQELAASKRKWARITELGAAALGIAGIVLIIAGLS